MLQMSFPSLSLVNFVYGLIHWSDILNIDVEDFPGGAVVESLPANVGNTGSIPGPGRSHMPQSSWARGPQLLSLCATTAEAHAPGARAPQWERPLQWEAHAPQQRVAPASRSWREPTRSKEDPKQPKIY